MPIRHVYTSPVPDDAATSIVRPSDWNSVHAYTLPDGIVVAGNTAGVMATISSGTVRLAGGNNITLSQNGNSITFSAANQSVQPGIQSVSAGAGQITTGEVVFANANGVSFGANGQTVTASVAAQSNQPRIQSIVAGANTVSTGAVVFAPANGVTFGLNGSTMTASHDGLTSQSNQAFSASGGSSAFQTLVFANANGLTFSNNGGSVQASYTVPSVTNSSLTLSDAATSITAARLAFSQSNGLTLSLSTNGGSATVVGSYTVPTVTNSSMTVSDAGTSGTLARLAFTNLNGVTLSLSTGAGGSHTIVGSHNGLTTQTVQSAIRALGVTNTGNTAGNTGVSTGINFVIAGTDNITVSQSTAVGGPNTIWLSGPNVAAGNITISAGASSDALGSVVFSNSNGVSFGLNGSTITASHNGLTSQSAPAFSASGGSSTFQTLVFSNANGLTFTNNAGSVQASYTVPTVTNSSLTLSDAATSLTIARLAFSQSNGLTLSLSTNGASATVVGSYTVPSVTNSSWTVSAPQGSDTVARLAFTNLNNVTLSLSTGAAGEHTIVGSVGVRSIWYRPPPLNIATAAIANSSVSIVPMFLEAPLAATRLRAVMSLTPATANNNSTAWILGSVSAVLYSRNVSTLSVMFSCSDTFTGTYSSNVLGSFSGLRFITASFPATTIPVGEYWWAIHLSTANTGGTGANTTALGQTCSMQVAPSIANGQFAANYFAAAMTDTRGAGVLAGIISTGATRDSIGMASVTVTGNPGNAAQLNLEVANFALY